VAGSCEDGNEPEGTTKGGEFFINVSYYQLISMDSVPWN
jgi:hypothetical protein